LDSAIEDAAKRDDVAELVRLAHAFPESAADVDAALVRVAGRLGALRNAQGLALILTLPERPRPWRAVETAVVQMVDLGPEVTQTLRSVALPSTRMAKSYAIRVLEKSGQWEVASELRSALQVHQEDLYQPAYVPEPPRGLGGWLVLPIITLFGTCLGIVLGFLGHVVPSLASQAWPVLPDSGLASDHGSATALFVFEVIARLLVFAGSIFLLTILFPKKKRFPRLALWYYPLSAIPSVVFYAYLLAVGADAFPRYAAQFPRAPIQALAVQVIASVLWIIYFTRSRRVKNTFVN
jgi:hypothetical protein